MQIILYRRIFPHLLLFPCLWALPRYSLYPVFMSYGLFWKCTFKVWNPTIYQATDFACQVLCGMNFWADILQTLLLSVTNVACHKIVIWFHLLHIFWVSKVLYCYKKNALDLVWYILYFKNNNSAVLRFCRHKSHEL